jgi:hypothetical protein
MEREASLRVHRSRHWSLFRTRWIQCKIPHPTPLKPILILTFHLRFGLLSGSFPSRFPNKSAFIFVAMHATHPDNLIRNMFGEKYKLLRTSLRCFLQPPIVPSLLSPNHRLYGLMLRDPGYRSRGSGSIPSAARFSEK